MEFKVYYEQDADLRWIRERKVGIIGYGSQGHAHALNLQNNEVDVLVGLAPTSRSRAKAEAAGLRVADLKDTVASCDVVMMLVPDEVMADVYHESVAPYLKSGSYLAFAHGFNVHFGKIVPPAGVKTFLVAPKSPGRMVRRQFEAGKGVPCLVATLEDDPATFAMALSYAKAIGGTRCGVFRTSFREETESDLFGEQAVLCGGLTSLVKAGFDTLVEQGYSPVMAYFECVHELKLIVDLIYEGGLNSMRRMISNTAEYGDYTVGPRVVDAGVRDRMREVLTQIQSGAFAETWLRENQEGGRKLAQFRRDEATHPMEAVGAALRERMGVGAR